MKSATPKVAEYEEDLRLGRGQVEGPEQSGHLPGPFTLGREQQVAQF